MISSLLVPCSPPFVPQPWCPVLLPRLIAGQDAPILSNSLALKRSPLRSTMAT